MLKNYVAAELLLKKLVNLARIDCEYTDKYRNFDADAASVFADCNK